LTDQIALDILVPKGGDLAALVKSLDGEYYDEVVSKLEERLVELTIPAGTVKQSEAAKLKDVLKADPFRLVRPFSDRDAQFARLGSVVDERNLYISDILPKAYRELTPFGFEAAAATAVVFARESAVIRPPQAEKHKVTSGA